MNYTFQYYFDNIFLFSNRNFELISFGVSRYIQIVDRIAYAWITAR